LAAWAGEALVNSQADVDVTGKDAADARTQAMMRGQSDALLDLISKLATSDQAKEIVGNLEPAKISSMVRGTEGQDEKISSNRYRARLIVTFDGDAISNLIGGKTGGGKEDVAPTVGSFMVIPAYEEEGNPMLWEENNPWRIVWKATGLEISSGDIV